MKNPRYFFPVILGLLSLFGWMVFHLSGCGSSGDTLPQPQVLTLGTNNITGVVTRADFNTELSGVAVRLKDRNGKEVSSFTTDSKGKYQLIGIEAGLYTLQFSIKDFTTQSQSVLFNSTSEAKQINVAMVVAKTYSLAGTTKDSKSGAAISGVSIEAKDSNGVKFTAFSDSTGAFAFSVPPDNFSYTTSREFYVAKTGTFSVNSSGVASPTSLTLSMEKNSGIFTGQVVNQLSNKGLNGATVSLGATGIASYTQLTSRINNVDGIFSIEISEGSYNLKVTADGFAPKTQTTAVTRNATASKTIALIPSTATLGGTVRDFSTNQPIKDVFVAILKGQTALTDSLGKYEFTNLAAGDIKVEFSKTNFVKQTLDITIKSGELVKTVDVALSSAGIATITGTVRDVSTGSPIANATVTSNKGPGAVTASDGTYKLTNIPQGEIVLTAGKGSFVQSLQTITIAAGETNRVVDFTLQTTPAPVSISGTVWFSGGTFIESTISAGSGNSFDIINILTVGGVPTASGAFLIYFPGLDDTKKYDFNLVVRRKSTNAVLHTQNVTVVGAASKTITIL